MNRTDASVLFPQKTGSLLPSSPQHPLSELWRSSWGWGVLAGPRPASLGQHCDQRDTLRMGPHRHTCGHLAFITVEDSSAGALLLCPGRPSIGHGGVQAAVRPVRGLGGVVRCKALEVTLCGLPWRAWQLPGTCLGTRHGPPCDAPTGLRKVMNDEHWAVSGM